jgi:hypothetical protein
MFPGLGAVPVPVLHRGRPGRGGDVVVGQDERVGVHRISAGQLLQGQGALVGVQTTAAPGPGISGDLVEIETDPADQQPGAGGPPGGAVVGDGELRTGHVQSIDPVGVADAGQGAPQRGDPLSADSKTHPLPVRRHRKIDREIPGVRAQRHPGYPAGQPGQRPAQQPRHLRAGIPITREQIRRQRQPGLSPGGHVRAPTTLALIVIGHPALLAAIDFHIGGVQIDRHRPQQALHPLRRQQIQHPLARPGHGAFHPSPRLGVHPPGQPRRRGGTQPRHRGQQLTRHIRAIPVQTDQMILPRQLGAGHPHQQLPRTHAPVPALDRPDHHIQQRHHTQRLNQLGHRRHPRQPGQRRIRRADPHPGPREPPSA